MPDPQKDYNALPEGVCEDARKAHAAIMAVLTKHSLTYTGGCTSFYSPTQWRERQEKYGTDSLLLVVYDGGDLASFFSYMYESPKLQEAMNKALEAAGFYHEPCTNWYSAIYKVR